MILQLKLFLSLYFSAFLAVDSEAADSLPPKSTFRCGVEEDDARTACGKLCIYNTDCVTGEFCWSTFPNICYINDFLVDDPAPVPVSTSNPMTGSSISPTIPLRTDFRCGIDEEDSRNNCGKICIFNSDCNNGENCWSTFPNICYINDPPTDKPTEQPINPPTVDLPTYSSTDQPADLPIPLRPDFRCGADEDDSRTNCGKVCIFNSDCNSGEFCWSTFPNACYIKDPPVDLPVDPPTSSPTVTLSPENTLITISPVSIPPATLAPITSAPVQDTKSPISIPPASLAPIASVLDPDTLAPITFPPAVIPTLAPVKSSGSITLLPITTPSPDIPSSSEEYSLRPDFRCGIDEEDSRTNCKKVCIYNSDCNKDKGEYCWSTFPNKCYVNDLFPLDPNTEVAPPIDSEPQSDFRCGSNEADARGNCKKECVTLDDCVSGEYCWSTLPNFCYAK